jgi:nascent polypeptide-associated complex subunit alpha
MPKPKSNIKETKPVTEENPPEEISPEESESDHEDHGDHSTHEHESETRKQTRHEQKLKKEIIKAGMKSIPHVVRITLLGASGTLFEIKEGAEIYKGVGDTYIVFGTVTAQELSAQAQAKAAEWFKESKGKNEMPSSYFGKSKASAEVEIVRNQDDEAEEADDDTSKMNPADIELVMQQANVTHAQAISALRRNNNDIVDAIMELTVANG